jgi:hypothetical protein
MSWESCVILKFQNEELVHLSVSTSTVPGVCSLLPPQPRYHLIYLLWGISLQCFASIGELN